MMRFGVGADGYLFIRLYGKVSMSSILGFTPDNVLIYLVSSGSGTVIVCLWDT